MNTTKRPRILVVEDDTALQRAVRRALTFAGFDVETASDGRVALELVTGAGEPPSLILLDLTLPKVDGLALCTQVRGFSNVPIIIMSARDRDEDVIKGLDAGADDYITKPFNVETLLARIRALQRRVGPALTPERSDRLVAGLLTIDFRSREVLYGDRRVRLTATEYKILERLARNPGRVYTYEDLLRSVWGP
ncbi:MAG: response regulator transcription factor, partial [Dehalococcoidia bacterium]|nr:response regulator transcription factor [Dehalococcoidia bacterium]